MGLFDFVKNAGAKIFGKDDDKPAGRKPGDADGDGKLDAGRGLSGHLRDHGIDPRNFRFTFQGDTVVVEGSVPDQDTREKAILLIGNVEGVAHVDDRLRVGPPTLAPSATAGTGSGAPLAGAGGASQSVAKHSAGGNGGWSSKTYTVQKGDTLSEIAQKMYGKANKYPIIFEANKPMLKDPDKIYPGQVLRIPPLEGQA
jgi:nucleoid-associated protein YgaU